MLLKSTALSALISLVLLPHIAVAHHSVAAEYDTTRSNTVEGVVTRVWYRNPHVRYHLSVTNDNGEEVIWNTHGHNIGMLTRMGWTKNTIKIGDKVSMTGDATRDGSPKLFIRTVVLPNGKVMTNGPVVLDAPLPPTK